MKPPFSRRIGVAAVVALTFVALTVTTSSAQAGNGDIVVDVFTDELNDDNQCSLREAVVSANTNDNGDTPCEEGSSSATDRIVLPAGTYTLDIINAGTGEDAAAEGDLDITESVHLEATGGRAVVDGGALPASTGAWDCDSVFGQNVIGMGDRIFHVLSGAQATFTGLDVTGGWVDHEASDTSLAQGGGILVSDTSRATLTNTRVLHNFAFPQQDGFAQGGGIQSHGELFVQGGSRVTENALRAQNMSGGGISADQPGSGRSTGPQGGNPHVLEVTDSRVDGNVSCSGSGDGGGIDTNVNATLTDSRIDHNRIEFGYQGRGGGLHVGNVGFTPVVTIDRVRIDHNLAGNSGENHGGGIASIGNVTLRRSTVTANEAALGFETDSQGGGIFTAVAMTIDRSTIDNNSVLTPSRGDRRAGPSPQGGIEGFGGGIYSLGDLDMINSTIANNEANQGGGLYTLLSQINNHLELVTVSRNDADDGGGVYVAADGAFLEPMGTIIADNDSNDCAGNVNVGVDSENWNLASDGTCNLDMPNDLPDANAQLNGLADNGGPTRTMSLKRASPAVDHVGPPPPKSNDGCPPPTIDQRNQPRPRNGDGNGNARCDIGAFELGPPNEPPPPPPPPGKFCRGFENDPRNQVVGTLADDVLTGTPGPDVICGRAGDDLLKGLEGNDLLLSGADDDRSFGGPGNDRVRGQRGNDRVVGGKGNDDLHGGASQDVVTGDSGNDRMQGHTGNDSLDGGEGNDVVRGEEQNDSLRGGLGNDNLAGGKHDDDLHGDEGDDTLRGRLGDDDLDGGSDTDDCDPGPGAGQSEANCEV